MDGDSPAADGPPAAKRQRVTKACDQCRRRRVKCEAYPDAGGTDVPCVVCTEAGTAASCTYTRPSKKRGPQAGYAKNLAEKISSLERLLGHLILVHPPTLSLCDSFFHSSCSTTPSAQTSAFNSSNLPAQLEAHPLKESPSSTTDSGDLKPQVPLRPLPAPPPPEAGTFMPMDDRNGQGGSWSPSGISGGSGPSPLVSGGAAGSALLAMSQHAGQAIPSTSMQPVRPDTMPIPTYYDRDGDLALQTLASAAVPDHSEYYSAYREGPSSRIARFTPASKPTDAEGANGGAFGRVDQSIAGAGHSMEGMTPDDSRAEASTTPFIPSLPSEGIRNQLLDLYFNQIVHPSFPMLDKTRFFRWSAHLPTHNAATSSAASTLPPELFLAVCASAVPYLSPASAKLTHSAAVFSAAARDHLYHALHDVKLETVQACVLLALCDWGEGELERGWILSCLSIALSINLNLHVSLSSTVPDPSSIRLKTFHSALIMHTLLSIRLLRPPIIVLEDYDIPLPPIDGAENFELWRSDKSPAVLRAEHGLPESPGNDVSNGPQGHAVRSCALSTFSNMASLCAIGVSILRWGVCPRRGNGQGLPVGERERQELVSSLQAWERDLPMDLRLGEQVRGLDKVEERSRHTVELHLVLFMLYLRLTPHSSFSIAHDPVPQALALLSRLLSHYRTLFTFIRSLPSIESALHSLSRSLFLSADYIPQQHDAALKAYEELAMVFPVGKTNHEALRSKVDEHRRELGLVRGIHPTPTSDSSLLPSTSPLPGAGEPFRAFLNYSTELGPSADPSTILDFGSWDQSDLLVSLGLVTAGSDFVGGWGTPPIANGNATRSPHPPMPPVPPNEGFNYSHLTSAPADRLGGVELGMGAETMDGGGLPWAQSTQDHPPTDLLSRWIGRGEFGGGGSAAP